MDSRTVYLVSGAGRGLGLKLVELLAARSNTIVYAGVRSFPPALDSALAALAANAPTVIIPIQLTSADEADNKRAAQLIAKQVGKVDVIIANAGASTGITPVATVNQADILSDFQVNSIGPLVLFQSFLSLITAIERTKFVVISSVLGQIAESLPYTYNAYGVSKAAVNFIAKKIHQETPQVIAFPIHPGMVDTDMGQAGAASVGLTTKEMGFISSTESAKGILAVIDASTKETHGGKFWDYNGAELTY